PSVPATSTRGRSRGEGEASDRILHTKLLADNPLNKNRTQDKTSTLKMKHLFYN
ncbi:hypothetical protein HMPREF9151_01373, partial [Hoylesella saccharolytica F0055]